MRMQMSDNTTTANNNKKINTNLENSKKQVL